ncbi:MAG: RND transporter [Gammaproteobacteria bacterium]|nr:RND transporter [Gammaproteobacteria bacterium]
MLNKFKTILIKIPVFQLALISLMLGLAPFVPEPHLFEKLKMLVAGELVKPIDIFDLFMHGTPVMLLILKLSWARSESN